MDRELSIILNLTHECNFNCGYCYYSDELIKKPGVMDLKVAEITFKRVAESSFKNIRFFFHGGEPLLYNVDKYNELIALQQHYLKGKTVRNSIQTNGSLINDSFIELFKNNNIVVGVSLDGPEPVHNYYRKSKAGKDTFQVIMNNVEKLAEKEISVAFISVVSDITAQYVNEIYPFFKSIKNIRGFDLMPETINPTQRILTKNNYSKVINQVFDEWFFDEECNFDLRILSSIVTALITGATSVCMFKENCVRKTNFFSIDIYGNVSPCDSLASVNLGNIKDNSINSLLDQNLTRRKLSISEDKIREQCWFCKWYKICHGGCPSYRTENEINCHCEDFYNIFEHIYSSLTDFGVFHNGVLEYSKIEKFPNPSLKNSFKKTERKKTYA